MKKIREFSMLVSVAVLLSSSVVFAAERPDAWEYTNSIGMKLMRIEDGSFMMGFGDAPVPDAIANLSDEEGDKPKAHAVNGNPDEYPNHKVTIDETFYMGAYEVTNAQYEQYDPKHRQYRGAGDLEKDADPVTMVSWDDAVGFCKWLSEKEELPYRLPTEAEWEFACRAGTTGHYYTGDSLPERNMPANKWGLYNMHGVAEEWCHDWYGPYEQGPVKDPVGRVDGDFKVTRGGSYDTAKFYRRSANRSGTMADDKSPLVGFRVVLGKLPKTKALPVVTQPYQENVSQEIPSDMADGPDPGIPYLEIRSYINIEKGAQGPLFYYHNHNPDIVQCPNGDLFAIHFSTNGEGDREMVYGGSRLRYGNKQWDKSSVVWGPPDRKAEYSVLWVDGGVVYNFSSVGVGDSRPGAIVMRSSKDNCATWSKPRTIVARADEQGVMENVFRTSKGAIVIPCDDHNLFVSYDNGVTWASPCNAKGPAGIHTPMMELSNGDLMAFGR
jgi:formylglycine-generating enzyme required for sulfatase activity